MARGARLPGEAWTARDWALQQAVDTLDAQRCSGCGQPRWLSHDKAHARAWKVTAERCFACDAIARRQDEMTSGDDGARRVSSIYFGATLLGQ